MLRLHNRHRTLRALSVWIIVSHVFGLVPAVLANPTGGSVVAGKASINQANPLVTTIRQYTDRAVIDWRTFGNTAKETIQFLQPGVTSATLNRITGSERSVIDGALRANGSVFLLNPNGVLFGKNAQVNVYGLTASTLSMDAGQFMSGGKLGTLGQDASRPMGAVVNQGQISAGAGGVTLVGPVVNNQGTIATSGGGKVNLGAGREALVSLDGEGLMTLHVTAGGAGNVRAGAQSVSSLLQSVVNDKQFEQAGQVSTDGGDVILGGAEGTAMNEGTIRTQGSDGVAAGDVHVDSTQFTALAPGSLISANGSGQHSNGGSVKVVSQGSTVFAAGAKIEARGGTTGNGGLVETSGDHGLLALGDVDTTALGGKSGSWLLDPDLLNIISGAAGKGDQDGNFASNGSGANGILFGAANTTLNTVSDGEIYNTLLTSDVILEAKGHIHIGSGVSITVPSNHNLYFHTTNGITDSNPQISGPSSGLAQISDLNANDTGQIAFVVDSGNNAGTIDLTNVSVDGAAGGVFINGPGNVIVDVLRAQGTNGGVSGIVNVTAAGAISRPSSTQFGSSEGIGATLVYLKAKGIGTSSLPVPLVNSPQVLVDQTAGGDVFLSSTLTAINIANVAGTGGFSLTDTGGNITLNSVTIPDGSIASVSKTFKGGTGSGLTATSSTVSLNTDSNIGTSGTSTLQAKTADLVAVKGISSSNVFTVSNLTAQNTGSGASGNINLTNNTAVNFDALNTATGGTITLTNSGGDLTVDSNNIQGAAGVTLLASDHNIVLTGTTTAGSASTASMTATLGSINGAGTITALTALLTAANGIGNSTQVKTSVTNLDLQSTGNPGGDISVSNSGTSPTVTANNAGGNINIVENSGKLTVGVVGTDSGVTAQGNFKTISLVTVTSGDLQVSNDVKSISGDIGVVSAGNLLLGANVTTQNGAGGLVDLIAMNGAITQSAGLVTAGTIAADATGGIGSATSRLQVATTQVQLGGLTVAATSVANAGADFLDNTSTLSMLLAGTGAGAIDVSQTGADLAVGLMTAGAFVPASVTTAQQTGLASTTSGKTITLTTLGSGNINVANAVSTTAGNIALVAKGGMSLADNVTTGQTADASIAYLVAQTGKITHTGGTVIAGNVGLDAKTGLGDPTNGNRVQTSTSNLQIGGQSVNGVPVNNDGNDFLANVKNAGTGVPVKVAGATNSSGVIDITQDSASLTVGQLTLATFDPNNPNSESKVTSTQQTGLTAAGATKTISLLTLTSGDITISNAVTTADSNIALVSAAGISLVDNVTTGSATDASLAYLVARSGAITHGNGTVTAGNIGMDATGGIGSATARVQTSTQNLQLGGQSVNVNGGGAVAAANDGSDFIANVKAGGVPVALKVAGATATSGAIDITQDSASLTVGQLQLATFDPANPNSAVAVTSAQKTGLTAAGASKTISLLTLTAGDVTVSNDVTSADSNIALVAAANIALGANVTTGQTGDSSLVYLIAQSGSITHTGGTVTAGNVGADATGGIGSATARVQTSTSNLQIGGQSVNVNGAGATVVNNDGSDFLANVKTLGVGVALKVAGATATSGAIDITQDSANLTIGQLQLGTFDPANPSSAAVVSSAQRTGLAATGASKTISLLTLTSGDIKVNNDITTADSNIGLVAAANIALGGNVTTGQTADGSLAYLIAQNGAITHTSGTVTAGNVGADATGGIGSATARVQTSTSNLQLGGQSVNVNGGGANAVNNDGSDFLANVKTGGVGVALKVAGATATSGAIDITEDSASLTIGQLQLGTFDPANPSSAAVVSSAKQTGLTATGASQTISLLTLTSGDIKVTSDITTADSKIGLVAAANIALGGNVTTGQTADSSLAVLIAQNGAITHTSGTVTAGNVGIDATGGIGSATARVQTSTSNLQLGGQSVNVNGGGANAVNNDGNDFLANVTTGGLGVALRVAGATSTDGLIDITQDSATLTVGQLTLTSFDPNNPSSAVVVTSAQQTGLTAASALGQNRTISLLTLTSGDITISNPVTTAASNIGLIAAANIALGANVTTGQTGDSSIAYLIAESGAITHSRGTVTAGSVGIDATGGIGSATARVQTSTKNLQIGGQSVSLNGGAANAVNNNGNDFLANVKTGGAGVALKVAGATSTGGAIDITQDSASLTIDQLQLATFDPASPSSAAVVSSAQQTGLTAAGSSRTISLLTLTSGGIAINKAVTTADSNIGIVSAATIALGDNVTTTKTSDASLAYLIAQNGSITHSGGTVTAGNVGIDATGGIGSATARVQTSTSKLQIGGQSVNLSGAGPTAVNNNGNDFLANVTTLGAGVPLQVAGATSTGGVIDITQDSASLTIGQLQLATFDPATPNSAVVVTSAQQTGLAATGAGQTLSLVTLNSGDITVTNAISTADSNIALVSAGGIALGNDVTTGKTADSSLVYLVAQAGAITHTGGTVTAGTVGIDATLGIGTKTARVQTSTSNLQIGGQNVNVNGAGAVAVANDGDDFLANVKTGGTGVPITVAGATSTAGVIDLTQDGATLTIGQFTGATLLAVFDPATPNSAVVVTSAAAVGLQAAGGSSVSLLTLNGGGMTINEPVKTGDGNIGLVSAAGIALANDVSTGVTGDASLAYLIAQNGSITHTAGTITAGNIGIDATGGIGSATARVQTSTQNLQIGGQSVNVNGAGAAAVNNDGNDFIANVQAGGAGVPMTVAGATTTGGLIDITQDSATLTVGQFTGATLLATFDPATPNSAAVVTSGAMTGLTATGVGKTISLLTLTTGDIKVNNAVTTADSNIGLVSAANIALGDNITTTKTGDTSLAYLIAQNGAITHSGGTVTAGNVGVDATGGIGSATARVQTSTAKLQIGGQSVSLNGGAAAAVSNDGSDFIANVKTSGAGVALKVAGSTATGGAIDITQDSATLTIDQVQLGTFDPSTPHSAAAVTSAQQTGLTAAGASKTISLVTLSSGDIQVNKAVTTADSNIGLVSAANIALGDNVTTTQTGDTSLAYLIARSGSITRTGGTVTAGNVGLDATGGIGGASARVQTSTAKLQIGGQSVNLSGAGAVAVNNDRDDYIANVKTGPAGVALTVAGANTANGVIDITQDSASLTIDQLQLATFSPAGASSAAAVTSLLRVGLTNASPSSTISLVTLNSGGITVDKAVTSSDGAIGLVSAAAIALVDNIKTGSATDTSLVDLIARGGAVTSGGGTVTAGEVAIDATGGIGTAAARVQTSTSKLQLGGLSVNLSGGGATAVANDGDDFIANLKNGGVAVPLTVAGATSTGGVIDITQDGAGLTADTVTIGAFDPAAPGTSAAAVTSAGRSGLAAVGAGKTLSLVTLNAGGITIDKALSTADSNVGIVSAAGIALADNVTTGQTADTSLVDLIARGGAITHTGGTVTSGQVALDATGGIGAATAGNRVQTSTSKLQLGGLSVNLNGGGATAIANDGDDFIANVKTGGAGVPLTVAGATSTGGVIDITQDSASLTAATLTIGAFDPAAPGTSAAAVTSALQTGLTAAGAGKTISLVTLTSGSIAINNAVSTADSNIGLVSAAGITLADNVTTGQTADASLVDLIARGGSITRTGGTLVTAGNIALDATAGIGSATVRLQTSTSNLQLGGLSVNGTAVTNAGDDFIANLGGLPLTIAGVDAGSIDVLVPAANLTVGTLTIGTFPPAAVTTAMQTGLTSTAPGKTITLTTTPNGNITFNQPANTNGGNVVLTPGSGTIVNNAPGGINIGSSGPGAFTLNVNSGNLLLPAFTSTTGFLLTVTHGSILDSRNGSVVNLTDNSGTLSVLSASGTIGTRNNPVFVNFNPGKLAVQASGQDPFQVAVNIIGTVLPENTLELLGTFNGFVVFNHRVLNPAEITTQRASPGLVLLSSSLTPADLGVITGTTLATQSIILLSDPLRELLHQAGQPDDFAQDDSSPEGL